MSLLRFFCPLLCEMHGLNGQIGWVRRTRYFALLQRDHTHHCLLSLGPQF